MTLGERTRDAFRDLLLEWLGYWPVEWGTIDWSHRQVTCSPRAVEAIRASIGRRVAGGGEDFTLATHLHAPEYIQPTSYGAVLRLPRDWLGGLGVALAFSTIRG